MDLDLDALLDEFYQESADLLDSAEEGLIRLEARSTDTDALKAIFRALHTIKGNASSLNLEPLAEFTHVFEEFLDAIRKGVVPVSARSISHALALLDALRLLLLRTADGKGELSPVDRVLMQATEAGVIDSNALILSPPGQVPAGSFGESNMQSLRIDIDKLDRMINLAGEITIFRSRLGQRLDDAEQKTGEPLVEAHRESDRLFMDLQEQVMKLRMVPVGPMLRKFIRVVRDLATVTGKSARLEIHGEEVELDARVLNELKDPLTHMLRNAVDHGLEKSAVRMESGKDPCGLITITVSREAGNVVIRVCDDGAGLDPERIIAQAETAGLLKGSVPEKADAFALLFESGFSTAEDVTSLSGRGVGLDVVKRNIEQLRGTIHVESDAGCGTQFIIRLPLTMAVIQGFNVAVGDETYVIPLESVVECLELPADCAARGMPSGVINVRDQAVPFMRLRSLFDLPGQDPERENVVIIQTQYGLAGLVADGLLGENQTVIKPLGKLFGGIKGIAGSSFLGNGKVALIIDVAEIFSQIVQQTAVHV